MPFNFDFGVGVRHHGKYDITSTRHQFSFVDQTMTSSGAWSASGVVGAFELGNVDINFNPMELSPESTSLDGDIVAVKVDRYQGVGGGISVNPDELELIGRLGLGSCWLEAIPSLCRLSYRRRSSVRRNLCPPDKRLKTNFHL